MSTTYTTGACVRAGDLNIDDLYRSGITTDFPVRRVTHKSKTMIIGEMIDEDRHKLGQYERIALHADEVYRVTGPTPPTDPCEMPTPEPGPTWRVGQRVEYNNEPATIVSIGQQRLFIRHDDGAEWAPVLDSSMLVPIKPFVPRPREHWGAYLQRSDNNARYASKVFATKQAAMNWCDSYRGSDYVCTIIHYDDQGNVTHFDRYGDEATPLPFDEWKAAQASATRSATCVTPAPASSGS